MRISFVPLLVLFALPAAAQTARRIERPFSLEAGMFFPNYDRLGPDQGVYAALGYAFYAARDVTLRGQVRGAYQPVAVGSGEVGPRPAGDLNVVSLFVDARYQAAGSRLFGGAGLGVGRANRVDGRDRSGPLLALEGGYDLSRSVYLNARYEFAGADTLRAGYVGLGFRF